MWYPGKIKVLNWIELNNQIKLTEATPRDRKNHHQICIKVMWAGRINHGYKRRVETPYLLPGITKVVNLSLSTGTMPKHLKSAILHPLIKKACLDSDILKHYSSISRITFISKVIDKVVAVIMNEQIYTQSSLFFTVSLLTTT